MPMTMDFEYREDGNLEHITFRGLDGRESAGNLKNALELLKIDNPVAVFISKVKAGEFDTMPEDEYRQIFDMMDFVSSLWRYPDAKEGEPLRPEMNVLMLLANAIEVASRQNAAITRHNAEGL